MRLIRRLFLHRRIRICCEYRIALQDRWLEHRFEGSARRKCRVTSERPTVDPIGKKRRLSRSGMSFFLFRYSDCFRRVGLDNPVAPTSLRYVAIGPTL